MPIKTPIPMIEDPSLYQLFMQILTKAVDGTTLPLFVNTMATYNNIGVGTASPNSSAVLDLTSTNQGFLPPRMKSNQRAAIASPAVGLMVYDTDMDNLMVYKSGTGWSICA